MTQEASPLFMYNRFLDKHAGLVQPWEDEHYPTKTYLNSY